MPRPRPRALRGSSPGWALVAAVAVGAALLMATLAVAAPPGPRGPAARSPGLEDASVEPVEDGDYDEYDDEGHTPTDVPGSGPESPGPDRPPRGPGGGSGRRRGSPGNGTRSAARRQLRESLRRIQAEYAASAFYVCPPPTGATVVQFEEPRPCPDVAAGKNFTEGIAVVFKENIAPYKFTATKYYKEITVSQTWQGSRYLQLTGLYNDRAPVPFSEITDLINGKGRCRSDVTYTRSQRRVTAYDGDEWGREVALVPAKTSTPNSRGWYTTDRVYAPNAHAGFYKTGTTVNCIVEEMEARSAFPYDSFVLATGEFVYASPFSGFSEDARRERNRYAPDRFRQVDGFYPRDLDSGQRAATPVVRNLLTTPTFTVGWDWKPKRPNVCSVTKWQVVEEMVRAEYGSAFRFTSAALSATFTSNLTQYPPELIEHSDCVAREAAESIEAIYARRYNASHVRVGGVQYYLAAGGFLLAFQPLLSNSLAEMYRREALLGRSGDLAAALAPPPVAAPASGAGPRGTISTTQTVEFARLQFTYDHIQKHVNEMLGRIAAAWCQLQNQELVLWNEARKLNPGAIASATVGTRVGARMLGDVMAVSTCIPVSPDNVIMQNSMRIPGDPKTCYARPLVSFRYTDEGELVEGQLGEDNEIRLEQNNVEPCTVGHKRYFVFGGGYVYFEEYAYSHQVSRADVPVVSTFVDLNLTMLEDHEFLPLEVYTRREIKDSGLLDYAEVQRRNQLHALRFSDIDRIMNDSANAALMAGLARFFDGMGDAGKAIGRAVLGVTEGLISVVSGVSSFLSNPFGALAVGLLVLAGLVAAFFAMRYIMRLRANPMRALYPLTTSGIKAEARAALGSGGDKGGAGDGAAGVEDFDEAKLEAARDMIRYMTLVSAMERTAHKAKKRGTSARISAHLTDMVLAAQGAEYQPLSKDDEDGADP
uniref:Envelope glycoprotein B n=1 Tax=Herpesvirus ateles type 1 (strain Lennette) TaxID=35243 RepID=GB_HSVA1|nr:RecName: Full=Envelope glycoprotein B; Short=gB; Flags: Precursor [Ateline alphaherpesvirus 1]AAA43839.1 glycoprotein gB [Ateline alphaherpesvirus 1]